MTIAELTNQILAFRDARDWAQFHRPKDMAAAVAIAVATVAAISAIEKELIAARLNLALSGP